MIRVLFVCLGNICRSPTAEGVFRALVQREGLDQEIETDSAGTAAYHVGEPPDERAQQAAKRRGVDLSDLRARQSVSADFDDFDYVLAMDRANYRNLKAICPADRKDRLFMFMDFAADAGRHEVPDPYYGGSNGFEDVLDLVEATSQGLLDHIRRSGALT